MAFCFLAICGIIVLVNLAVFTFRGLGKSLVRLVTLGAALIGAYALSRLIAPALLLDSVQQMEELIIATVPAAAEIATNPVLEEVSVKLAQMLLMPLLFIVGYGVLKLVGLILYHIVCRFLPQRVDDEGVVRVNHWGAY